MDLFHTEGSNDMDNVLALIPNCVTNKMNEVLTRHVDAREIQEALTHMDPRKAPGIDGLS